MGVKESRSLEERIGALVPEIDAQIRDGLRDALRTLDDAQSPEAMLTNMRRPSLRLLRILFEQAGKPPPNSKKDRDNLFSWLSAALDHKILPAEIDSFLELARVLGNKAVHEPGFQAEREDCRVVLSGFLCALQWFYRDSEHGPHLESIYSEGVAEPLTVWQMLQSFEKRFEEFEAVAGLKSKNPAVTRGSRARLTDHLDSLGKTLKTRIENRRIFESKHFIPRHYRTLNADNLEDRGTLDLATELEGRKGFTLFGDPGSGKTISFYMLAGGLLVGAQGRLNAAAPVVDGPGGTGDALPSTLLPVLIEARDLVVEVKGWLHADPRCDVPALVYEYIRGKFVRPYGPQEEVSSPEKLAELCAASGTRPVILFEAFDELISPIGLKTPLTKVVVEQLELLDARYDLAFAVSSRFKEKDTLKPLRLKDLGLQKLIDDEVVHYVEQRWPGLPVTPREVAATFREKMDSRPLYLFMLCDYFRKRRARSTLPANRATLLRDCTDGVIGEQLARIPWDQSENGGHQRRCLRRLAYEIYLTTECTESRIEALAWQELGEDGTLDRVNGLVSCLKHFLIEEGRGIRFCHLVQRDYFLTDALLLYIVTGRVDIPHPLMIIHAIPEIIDLLVLLLDDSPSGWEEASQKRLIDDLGPPLDDLTPQEPRTKRNEPTAALALLVRLFPGTDRSGLDCHRRCFQGLSGANMDFRGINFAESCLRNSDLRGAVLNEAKLRGANLDDVDLRGASLRGADLRAAILQNAQLGCLKGEAPGQFLRDGQPTDLTWARLKDSDWFNVRIKHNGYFQLWTTRLLPNGRDFLVSTTRGDLRFMDVDGADPVAVPAGHDSDVLGFDYLEPRDVPQGDSAREKGWGWLATCSRDGHVRFFRVDLNARPPRLDPPHGVVLLRSSSDYFTRLKFEDGWLAVGDRAGNVYFMHLEEIARLEARGPDSVPDYEKYLKHTGAVVCIEGAQGIPGPDKFFSAGYDGRIFGHREREKDRDSLGSDDKKHWEQKLIVDIHKLSDRKAASKGNEYTIRAVTPWWSPTEPRDGRWLGGESGTEPRRGLWLGDESGCIRFHDLASEETQLVDHRQGERVFAVAVSPDSRELAVGLGGGQVLLYDLDMTGGLRGTLRRHLWRWLPGLLGPDMAGGVRATLRKELPRSPCGDIVRSLLYLDNGGSLLIVTWAGLVRVWSTKENLFTLDFDPKDLDWKPADDRQHLLLGSGSEVNLIRGLSPRYLTYLSLLGQT
jgi:WD40 repeat protein